MTDWEQEVAVESSPELGRGAILVGIAAAVATMFVVGWALTDVDGRRPRPEPSAAAQAAEVFDANRGRDSLRSLLAAIGGIDELVVTTADGAFDMVTFDPADPDRLLATRRSSYGPAENQMANEEWRIADGHVVRSLFAPDVSHDFVHFNADGTISRWASSGNTLDFASRVVTTEPGGRTSGPIYASRSVVVDGLLFALTDSEEYYTNDPDYLDFVVDVDGTAVRLWSGAPWGWLDSPADGFVVTYPRDASGSTMVWSTETLVQLFDHPLARRPYERVAVSGDGRIAVGVTFDHELEMLTLPEGESLGTFGRLDPTGITQAISLNQDGTVAVTVDFDGTVTMWWVGDDRPVFSLEADAGPMRLMPERRAPRISSAVAPGADRVALRLIGTPEDGPRWQIIDTDVDAWLERASNST